MYNFLVRRGAKFLDKRRPGWAHHVDTFTLDMNDPYDCILGQVYGYYIHGLEEFGILTGWTYGFDVPALFGEVTEKSYEKLNKAWNREINKRLAE